MGGLVIFKLLYHPDHTVHSLTPSWLMVHTSDNFHPPGHRAIIIIVVKALSWLVLGTSQPDSRCADLASTIYTPTLLRCYGWTWGLAGIGKYLQDFFQCNEWTGGQQNLSLLLVIQWRLNNNDKSNEMILIIAEPLFFLLQKSSNGIDFFFNV